MIFAERRSVGILRSGYNGWFITVNVHLLWQLMLRWALLAGLSVVLFQFFCVDSSRAQVPEADDPAIIPTPERVKTVVDLQPFRSVQSIGVGLPNGQEGEVTLINLNPKNNQWFILSLNGNDDGVIEEYHLENPYPEDQRLTLDENSPEGLKLTRNGERLDCPPWNFFGDGPLQAARQSRQVFAPLCDGRLYLRNPTKGHRTTIESVTDFLRDNLPGGEAVVGFVKDTFFQDAFEQRARTAGVSSPPSATAPDFPLPARVNSINADRLIVPAELGIQVDNATAGMHLGRWYAVKNIPGIFVSLMQPQAVAPEILKSYPRLANPLDSVEAGALVYLVAFDLDRFSLGFAVGSEHPRVGWSERTVEKMRIADLPGPDGIGTIAPLVPNGMVNPVEAARTVATFTGGFKRSHGAFKYGDLAYRNHGSHYGFMENGTILSRLQPDLATLVVWDDGDIEMKTWLEEDNRKLGRIAQARQNGVPLVEWDPTLQQPMPGRLVARWSAGNWSGSQDEKLRTLRAGAALQQNSGKRFLIYGYFSTATPSAMARVFQAYNCRYAMHLDMNALEHTYLALYPRDGGRLLVQHLIQGMSVLDKSDKGPYIPRFLGYPDNRDFFYVMLREQR